MSVSMRKLTPWLLGVLSFLSAVLMPVHPLAWADSAQQATVKVANSDKLGQYLTDGQGRTLYLFAADTQDASKCYDFCANTFRAYTIDGEPVAGDGVNASRLGTLKREDGATQVSYAGHPLYHFLGDMKPGSTSANNTKKYGGIWSMLAPDGSVAVAAAKTETETEEEGESAKAESTAKSGTDSGNPLAGSQEAVAAGKSLYSKLGCYACHGRGGGGGMGPSLIDKGWRYGSGDEDLFQSIAEGRPKGMPPFGSHINDKNVWQLVAFLRSLSSGTKEGN